MEDDNRFSQEQKDRVYEKYATFKNLNRTKEEIKALFTPEEFEILMYAVRDKAIERYNPIIAQKAMMKIMKATGGRLPMSPDEMGKLIEKHLGKDEIADFMGFLMQKTRDAAQARKN